MVLFLDNHLKAGFWQLDNGSFLSEMNPTNRGPSYKPEKDRDYKGKLNVAEGASKAG